MTQPSGEQWREAVERAKQENMRDHVAYWKAKPRDYEGAAHCGVINWLLNDIEREARRIAGEGTEHEC